MDTLAWVGLAVGYGVWLIALSIAIYQRPLTKKELFDFINIEEKK